MQHKFQMLIRLSQSEMHLQAFTCDASSSAAACTELAVGQLAGPLPLQVYKGIRGGVQDVAIKVLLCKDEEQLLAFEKEIGILKSISYDRNIVQVWPEHLACCL